MRDHPSKKKAKKTPILAQSEIGRVEFGPMRLKDEDYEASAGNARLRVSDDTAGAVPGEAIVQAAAQAS